MHRDKVVGICPFFNFASYNFFPQANTKRVMFRIFLKKGRSKKKKKKKVVRLAKSYNFAFDTICLRAILSELGNISVIRGGGPHKLLTSA